ncbi:hypothetical protein [Nocardiopsis xinjiangensis]|uniref:hypothetical protein n=1 Tax=Nocardiopsis xinjiangensis TaxID=124285 RepID=UPI0003466924|nr:hypothetical protein [Nocardiopsis xinjiangensis]
MNLDPPPPAGLLLHELTPGQVETVLEEVFTLGVRCGLLDHPPTGVPVRADAPQWLVAELGDGRITGACPRERWRRSDPEAAASSAPAPGPGDRWRILEVLVFTPHVQIRLGEGGERGWLSADAPEPLPAPLRPRDRAFLLRGHNGPEYRRPVRCAPGLQDAFRSGPEAPGTGHGLQEPPPLTVTSEPDGTRAVLPLEPADTIGTTRPLGDGRTLARTSGAWLTVREYWAEDPATGAVGVAFHRLTGLLTGSDPAGPGPDPGTGDPVEEG